MVLEYRFLLESTINDVPTGQIAAISLIRLYNVGCWETRSSLIFVVPNQISVPNY